MDMFTESAYCMCTQTEPRPWLLPLTESQNILQGGGAIDSRAHALCKLESIFRGYKTGIRECFGGGGGGTE